MSVGSLRLVQVQGAAGHPSGKGPAVESVSVRLPVDLVHHLGLRRGDFMLCSLAGKSIELHTIEQAALESLLLTVQKDDADAGSS